MFVDCLIVVCYLLLCVMVAVCCSWWLSLAHLWFVVCLLMLLVLSVFVFELLLLLIGIVGRCGLFVDG